MLRYVVLAGVALCGFAQVAEARCRAEPMISSAHSHSIFCSSPNDPDLARELAIFERHYKLDAVYLFGQVDLLMRMSDGSLRVLEPYMHRLRTTWKTPN